jgi:hypothetical protein
MVAVGDAEPYGGAIGVVTARSGGRRARAALGGRVS